MPGFGTFVAVALVSTGLLAACGNDSGSAPDHRLQSRSLDKSVVRDDGKGGPDRGTGGADNGEGEPDNGFGEPDNGFGTGNRSPSGAPTATVPPQDAGPDTRLAHDAGAG
jgi:hypothetical protein